MRLSIADECHLINGGSWSADEYADDSHGKPVLKVSNFQREGIDHNDLSLLSNEYIEKYKKNKLELHDLIVATVGSHPGLVNSAAGRSTGVTKKAVGYYLNQNALCIRVKNNAHIDQRFLVYLAKTNVFEHFIQQRGKGAANQMRIPIGGIKEFTFDFPDLHTQQKIARRLSRYDDLIEVNLRRIRLLEELARETYLEWFVVPGLPEGWSKVRLDSLVEHDIGGGWGTEKLDSKHRNTAYVIRGTDIDGLKIGNRDNVPHRYHTASNLTSRKLQGGDIVFEVSGGSTYAGVAKSLLITDGVLGLFDDAVMCASFCKLLRPSEVRYSYFLSHFLSYLRDVKQTEIFEKRSASNIVNYNWTAFLKYQEVKLPDKKVLNKFNDFAASIYQQIANMGQQNTRLREARDLLLPRLMVGVEEA